MRELIERKMVESKKYHPTLGFFKSNKDILASNIKKISSMKREFSRDAASWGIPDDSVWYVIKQLSGIVDLLEDVKQDFVVWQDNVVPDTSEMHVSHDGDLDCFMEGSRVSPIVRIGANIGVLVRFGRSVADLKGVISKTVYRFGVPEDQVDEVLKMLDKADTMANDVQGKLREWEKKLRSLKGK